MIKPMLANSGKGIDPVTLVGTHTFDLKLDGVRSMAYWNGTDLTLINRSGRDQTVAYPDLAETFPDWLHGYSVLLDGEIVSDTGSFEDVARRDKVSKPHDVARAMLAYPVKYVAFDVLEVKGEDFTSERYTMRRAMLLSLLNDADHTFIASVASERIAMIESTKRLGLEGVIAKRNDSRYRPGRSGDWLKFKNVHRITAIATGYEPGEGSRAHFGAMYLAVISDGDVVPIGRVGTGFSVSDTWDVKARLDAHQPFVVEIEASNVTQSNQLRFPVFKGIRSDLSVDDATIDQLDALPRS